MKSCKSFGYRLFRVSRPDPAEEIALYQYVRHIFAARDSPTRANFAHKRNATDNEATFPEAVFSVKNNFYMDDYLESSPTVEKTCSTLLQKSSLKKRSWFWYQRFTWSTDREMTIAEGFTAFHGEHRDVR